MNTGMAWTDHDATMQISRPLLAHCSGAALLFLYQPPAASQHSAALDVPNASCWQRAALTSWLCSSSTCDLYAYL